MEKQTIGQFLSALRRSNGYTQQEVAEKLSVSNKTVSCWERDAYSPDISLIPAIAELYGVSCDEILRAKRIQQINATEGSQQSNADKAEKEASAIFAHKVATYENSQKIAIAAILFAAVAAIIVAVITQQLTDVRLWAFAIGVPALSLCIFLLILINYRLNFAVSDDERAFETKKRMYRRKNLALNLLIVALCAFIPCGIYISYNFKYYLYGIAFAVIAGMAIVIAELVRRIKKPQYYSPLPLKAKKALLALYCVLFIVALAGTFAYKLVLNANRPLYYPYEERIIVCKDIDELQEYLERNTVPDYYTIEVDEPSGDYNQIAIYSVSADKFNEDDFASFGSFSVTSEDNGLTYKIYVIYRTLNIEYTYKDPESGEKKTDTRRIVLYNENCQADSIKKKSDGSYELHTPLYLYHERKTARASDEKDYKTLLFGAITAAGVLAVFGAAYAATVISVKKRERQKTADEGPETNDNR